MSFSLCLKRRCEEGSPTSPGVKPGPAPDDAGQYPIMGYPKRPGHPKKGGGGRDTNNGNAGNR